MSDAFLNEEQKLDLLKKLCMNFLVDPNRSRGSSIVIDAKKILPSDHSKKDDWIVCLFDDTAPVFTPHSQMWGIECTPLSDKDFIDLDAAFRFREEISKNIINKMQDKEFIVVSFYDEQMSNKKYNLVFKKNGNEIVYNTENGLATVSTKALSLIWDKIKNEKKINRIIDLSEYDHVSDKFMNQPSRGRCNIL